MRRDRQEPTSPISFPVNVARLPQKGMPVVIDADARQREGLAKEHGIASVESLRADLLVEKWKRNGIRVSGQVTARIIQECVVTLDPIDNTIEEPIDALFLPDDSRIGREGFDIGGEIMLDPDGPDSPETFSGDTVDVGALAEQFFGLAIDPYPRKSGTDATKLLPEEQDGLSPWQARLAALARKS